MLLPQRGEDTMSMVRYTLSILEYSLIIFALVLMLAIAVMFLGNTSCAVLELKP